MGLNCNYVADGYAPEEIKKNLWDHAERDHPEVFKSLTAEKKKELTAKMDALMGKSETPTSRPC
jgi:predicted small metal-binding protein